MIRWALAWDPGRSDQKTHVFNKSWLLLIVSLRWFTWSFKVRWLCSLCAIFGLKVLITGFHEPLQEYTFSNSSPNHYQLLRVFAGSKDGVSSPHETRLFLVAGFRHANPQLPPIGFEPIEKQTRENLWGKKFWYIWIGEKTLSLGSNGIFLLPPRRDVRTIWLEHLLRKHL